MKKNKIFLSSPHMSEQGYEKAYIEEAFNTNWIAPLGKNVDEFENELARFVKIDYVAALTSGTAAIHLALRLLDVQSNDVVFCSSLTFSATANPIIYQNATPVFIDSEAATWNMDPQALEKAFEKYPNPKAVILVHLYGQPANMDRIVKICHEHHTALIEDAAESLGSTYHGKHTGTFGEFGIYSFNGNKIITTSGGGALISSDAEKIKRARFMATQSRDIARHYQHSEIGFNYRLSNVLAGIGRGQLEVLNDRIAKKRSIYNKYQQAFKDITDIEMMPEMMDSYSNHWLSVMTLKNHCKVKPIDIMLALEKENIESRPVWKPMHLQPVFEKYDFITVEKVNSIAQDLFDRGVCLPSDTKMTEEEQNKIIKIIRDLFD